MRIRALKPGFFRNEGLAELSPWHRLCFAGLWLCADKAGRLEDRPKRLKAEIFPYDNIEMDHLLWDLDRARFIIRYEASGLPFISLPTWAQHQRPRPDEADSTLPAYSHGMERISPSEHKELADSGVNTTLHSDESVTPTRIGSGILDLGSGKGNGNRDSGTRAAATAALPSRAQDLIDLWNATITPPIPPCRELTSDRRLKINARLSKRPFKEWRAVFDAVQQSAFCRGENDRGWTADFDWVVKNDTIAAKLLERAQTRPVEPAPISRQGQANRDAMARAAARLTKNSA